jgi:hypothetical protein
MTRVAAALAALLLAAAPVVWGQKFADLAVRLVRVLAASD